MAVRPQDLVFYAGGECLRDYGVLVKRTSPGEEIVETYTRTGTPQNPDNAGKLIKAAANVPVVSWWDDDGDGIYETPRLQLEAGLENLVDEDNLDNWTKEGTPVVTGGQTDPAGGSTAYTVADDDGASQEYIHDIVSFTGDGVKTLVFAVAENAMPGTGVQTLQVYDGTAPATRLLANITGWVAGEPTISVVTGTELFRRSLGNGFWALYFQTTSVVAANTNSPLIFPAYTAAQTGSIDVYRVHAYDSAVPLTSILNAGETLGASAFSYPCPFPPQAMDIYVKTKNLMLANTGDSFFVFSLGNHSSAGSMALYANNVTDFWVLLTRTTAGGLVTSTIGGANLPTIGDPFEFRISVPATGDITWGVSKDEGTEATQTHAPGTWDAAFNALFLYLAMTAAGANQGFAAFDAVKIVLDPTGRDYTLAELQDAA